MVTFRNKPVHSVEKIYDLQVMHKGFPIPVTVYLVEETIFEFVYHCVCFENTRYDNHLTIDKRESGEWFDLTDRDDLLASAIGQVIEAQEPAMATA